MFVLSVRGLGKNIHWTRHNAKTQEDWSSNPPTGQMHDFPRGKEKRKGKQRRRAPGLEAKHVVKCVGSVQGVDGGRAFHCLAMLWWVQLQAIDWL